MPQATKKKAWEQRLEAVAPELYRKYKNDRLRLTALAMVLTGGGDPELEKEFDALAKSRYGSNPIQIAREIAGISAGGMAPQLPQVQPGTQPFQPGSNIPVPSAPENVEPPPSATVATDIEGVLNDLAGRFLPFLNPAVAATDVLTAPPKSAEEREKEEPKKGPFGIVIPKPQPAPHQLQSPFGEPLPFQFGFQLPIVKPEFQPQPQPQTTGQQQPQPEKKPKPSKTLTDLFNANDRLALLGGSFPASVGVVKVPQGSANAGKYAVVPRNTGGSPLDRLGTWQTYADAVAKGDVPVFNTQEEAQRAAQEINKHLEQRFKGMKSGNPPPPISAFDMRVAEEASRAERSQKSPNTPPVTRRGYPSQIAYAGEPLRRLYDFATQNGFVVTDGFATSGHNPGSKHYRGLAIDVRTRDKTPREIDEFIKKARAAGFKVVDERTRPKGQKVWTGPHLHLEYVDTGMAAFRQIESAIDSAPPDATARERLNYNFNKLTRNIANSSVPTNGMTPYEAWSSAMAGYQQVTRAARRVVQLIDGLLNAVGDRPEEQVMEMVKSLGLDIKKEIASELASIGYEGPLPEFNRQGLLALRAGVSKVAEYGHGMVSLLSRPENRPRLTPADKMNYYGLSPSNKGMGLADRALIGIALYGGGDASIDSLANFLLSPNEDGGFLNGVKRTALGIGGAPANLLIGGVTDVDPDVQRELRELNEVIGVGGPDDGGGWVKLGKFLLMAPFEIGRYLGDKITGREHTWAGLERFDPTNEYQVKRFKEVAEALEKRFNVKFSRDRNGIPDVNEVKEFVYKQAQKYGFQTIAKSWDDSFGPITLPGVAMPRAWRAVNLLFDAPSIIYAHAFGRPVLNSDEYRPGAIENTAYFTADLVGTIALTVATGGVAAFGKAATKGAIKLSTKIGEKAALSAAAKSGLSRELIMRGAMLAQGTIGNPKVMAEAAQMGLVFGIQEASEELTDQLAMGAVDAGAVLYAGVSSFVLGAITGGFGGAFAKAAPWIVKGTGGFVSPRTARWVSAVAGETAIFAGLQPTIESFYSEDGLHYVPPSAEDWYQAFLMVGMGRTLGKFNDPDFILSQLARAAARGRPNEFQAEAGRLLGTLSEEERASVVQQLRDAFAKVQVRNYVQNAFARMRTAFNMTARDHPADEPRRMSFRQRMAELTGNVWGFARSSAEAMIDFYNNNPRLKKNRRDADHMLMTGGLTLEEELALVDAVHNPLIVRHLLDMGVDVNALRARAKILGIDDNNYVPFVIHNAKWWEIASEALHRATGLRLRDLMSEGDMIIIGEEINARKVMGVGVDPGEMAREEERKPEASELRKQLLEEEMKKYKGQKLGKKKKEEILRKVNAEVERILQETRADDDTEVDVAKPGIYVFDGRRLVWQGENIAIDQVHDLKPLYHLAVGQYAAMDKEAMQAMEDAGLLEPAPKPGSETEEVEDYETRAKARYKGNGASRDATRNEHKAAADLARILEEDTGLTPEEIADYVSAGSENETLDVVFRNMKRQLDKAGVKIEMSASGKSALINGRKFSVTGERGAILTAWHLLRNDALPEIPKSKAEKAKKEPPKPEAAPEKPTEAGGGEAPKAEEGAPKTEAEEPKVEEEAPKEEEETPPKTDEEAPKTEVEEPAEPEKPTQEAGPPKEAETKQEEPPKEKPKAKPKGPGLFRRLADTVKRLAGGPLKRMGRERDSARRQKDVEEERNALKDIRAAVDRVLDEANVKDENQREFIQTVVYEHTTAVRVILGNEPVYKAEALAKYLLGLPISPEAKATIESDVKQLMRALEYATNGRFQFTDEGVRFRHTDADYYYLNKDTSLRGRLEAISMTLREVGFEDPGLYQRIGAAVKRNARAMTEYHGQGWDPNAEDAVIIYGEAPPKEPEPPAEAKTEGPQEIEVTIIDPVEEVRKRLPPTDEEPPKIDENMTKEEAIQGLKEVGEIAAHIQKSIDEMEARVSELKKEADDILAGRKKFGAVGEASKYLKSINAAIQALSEEIPKLKRSLAATEKLKASLEGIIKKREKEEEAARKKEEDEKRKAQSEEVAAKHEEANAAKKNLTDARKLVGSVGGKLTQQAQTVRSKAERLYLTALKIKIYNTRKLEDDKYLMSEAAAEAKDRLEYLIDSMGLDDPQDLARAAIEEVETLQPKDKKKLKGDVRELERSLRSLGELITNYDASVVELKAAKEAFEAAYKDYKETADKYGIPTSKSLDKYAESVDESIDVVLSAGTTARQARTPRKAAKAMKEEGEEGAASTGKSEKKKAEVVHIDIEGEVEESRPKPKKRAVRNDIGDLLEQLKAEKTQKSEGEVVTGIEPVVVSEEAKQKRSRAKKEAGEEKTKAGKEKAKGKKKKASAEEEIVKIDIDTTPVETPESAGEITGQTRKRRMRC
jgi:hypothetical protein